MAAIALHFLFRASSCPAKQRLLAFLTRRSVRFGSVHHIIEIAGALLMTGFGLLMLSPWLAGLPR